MQIYTDIAVVEAARRIAPVIREHREEAERERRLSPPVLAALHESGLLRMFTPRSLGGLETDPVTRARVVEEIASQDSAAGWSLVNPLDWAHLCARLPDEGVQEIYSRGANIMIAAQFGRPLTATPVRGGYRIAGQSPFVSNCHDADWISMTALVTKGEDSEGEDNGEPEGVMAFFPADSCQIIDTWHVLGMRGTGSNDILVNDVLVPKARTFPMVPEFEPGSHYQGPLYQFPVIGIAATSIPPVMLAVARGAIDEVLNLAQAKTPVAASSLLRERASTQTKIAQAEGLLRSARLMLYDALVTTWETTKAGEPLSLSHKADLLLASVQAANSATQAVELVYSVAGTSGIRTSSPLERHFRDIQVLRHHALVAEPRYATVGQVYLGLSPDFPVLRF